MSEDFSQLARDVIRFADNIIKAIENTAQDIADLILFEAMKNLTEGDFRPAIGKGAYNRGQLSRSGRIIQEQKFMKVVEFRAPYARDIEYGRKPGEVSDQDIIEWVWDKKAEFGINKRYQAEKAGKTIAESIRKNGTLPRPFFRRAIASLTPGKIRSIIRNNLSIVQ